MNNLASRFGAIALVFCAACARNPPSAEQQGEAGPPISVSESTQDFGIVTEGDKLEHTFVLTNTSTKPLDIDRVETNCDCLKADLNIKQISAGGKGEIKAVFDTSKRIGDQDKAITITPRDSSIAPIKVRMHARLQPQLGFRRAEKDPGASEDMYVGDKKVSEVWLDGKHADAATLVIDKVTAPDVNAELITKQEGDRLRKGLRITIQATKLGAYHGMVILSTGVESKPKVMHHFDWSVVSNMTITPPSVHYEINGPTPVSPKDERVVLFKSRLDKFEVRGAKSNSAVFRPTIRRGSAPNTYELHLQVTDPNALAKLEVANIEVSTNDPVQPRIDISITVAPPIVRNTKARPPSSVH